MKNPQPATSTSSVRTSALLLKFMGSMNLAITLLVALSIAAIIGTVLQQNQSYTDYIIKFGPFWFDVFNQLGLYDVYSSSWFLFILLFLLSNSFLQFTAYRVIPIFMKVVPKQILTALFSIALLTLIYSCLLYTSDAADE